MLLEEYFNEPFLCTLSRFDFCWKCSGEACPRQVPNTHDVNGFYFTLWIDFFLYKGF